MGESSVGIVTEIQTEWSGVRFPDVCKRPFFPEMSKPSLGLLLPPPQWVIPEDKAVGA